MEGSQGLSTSSLANDLLSEGQGNREREEQIIDIFGETQRDQKNKREQFYGFQIIKCLLDQYPPKVSDLDQEDFKDLF